MSGAALDVIFGHNGFWPNYAEFMGSYRAVDGTARREMRMHKAGAPGGGDTAHARSRAWTDVPIL
jgi:hypothetical protein